MKKLLLVEDDKLIAKALKMSLHYRGFEIDPCETIEAGYELFTKKEFDIVILDVNLPDGSGYSLCQKLREQKPEIPILMLTARVDEGSAVKGIESGADDYVRKPFGLDELTARLNRLVGHKKTDVLTFHSLRISPKQRQAWVNDTPVSLYKREFDILALLVRKAGDVVSREEILNALEKGQDLYDRTIDSHLSHLRKKLKEASLQDVQITPVYGVGYRLELK